MDEIRFDANAYDPARVNAVLREARRMRNEVMRDLFKAIFDGRLVARLTGHREQRPDNLPHGTAPQG